MSSENQYLQLLRDVLKNGVRKEDRTGTGTISTFGYQMRFPLSEGFPLLTTKRVSFKMIASELFWFMRGDTNIRYLLQNNNNIWNEWAFKRWVESNEYSGPDMTDFGLRSQRDETFAEAYKLEMASFKSRILEDESFALWRARGCLRETMAGMEDRAGRDDRSAWRCHPHDQEQSGFAEINRIGLESGGCADHGFAAVPHDVPILRGGRQAVLSAVSAQRRHLLGHPV
jgi:hypothetical protein